MFSISPKVLWSDANQGDDRCSRRVKRPIRGRQADDPNRRAAVGGPHCARCRAACGRCVLVSREDHLEALAALGLPAEVVLGGATRTASELAGLAALADRPDLIAIHDGARPLVPAELVSNVLHTAAEVGGAVPILALTPALITRDGLGPVKRMGVAQTPQAFRARS